MPGVEDASASRSTSLLSGVDRVCTFRILRRPLRSGAWTATRRSNRPGCHVRFEQQAMGVDQGRAVCQAGQKAAPPDSGTLLERTDRDRAVVDDGANYAIAGVLWRVAARLRIAVSTTSGWESIGTWLLSTA